MRMVKGLSQTAAERISAARQQQPFRDIADLARRAQLNAGDIKALAASDACATLTGNRRQAQWQALGIEEPLPLFPDPQTNEATPLLIPPREGEEIIADYSRVGLSLRRHPLALLRPRLRDLHCLSSEDLRRQSNGQRIITGGIVTSRQRPGTASGVVFLTLEDEFGQINVIVWRRLVERYRRAVVGAYLLVVEGEIQCKDEVLHIVAHRLHDQSALIGALPLHSRDFH
jgi:error-prone DNA polymerase